MTFCLWLGNKINHLFPNSDHRTLCQSTSQVASRQLGESATCRSCPASATVSNFKSASLRRLVQTRRQGGLRCRGDLRDSSSSLYRQGNLRTSAGTLLIQVVSLSWIMLSSEGETSSSPLESMPFQGFLAGSPWCWGLMKAE